MGELGLRSAAALVLVASCAGPAQDSEPADEARLPHRTLFVRGPKNRIPPGEGWCSEWLTAPFPFDELLPSWNVDVPEGASFRIEVMVGGGESPENPSPWLDLGGWGEWPAAERAAIEFDGGCVEIDLVKLEAPRTRWRWRIETRGTVGRESFLPRYFRACFTSRERLERSVPSPDPDAGWIDVSLRRQHDEAPELASRICSPTAVAMVLAYLGVDRPTAEIAALLYDREHEIYGNWNRAVQGAWTLHVPGYLTRISTWAEAALHIEAGRPLVISIGVEEGQLTGAPYRRTDGHLVVLCGFDGEGNAVVMDPAVPVGDEAPRRYALDELETVWLRRGGVAYVLGYRKFLGHDRALE